ncbi:60S ribosomal protein L18-3 [Platanthera guangdongensis]|uniref:60S ribosomal protein L18-3 n=1 Tax=Platanthera guangdongensis TaxID=2320717 RepID=A0ABR2MAC1_9ASPA
MGIDLIAGSQSKKTKRIAPKSDDVYLKLLVKTQRTISMESKLGLNLFSPGKEGEAEHLFSAFKVAD